MDRRTWIQLIGILSAAQAGYGQALPASGGRGPQQQPPTVTREQVATALKLIGLEFQDSEIDSMLRGVNQAVGQYDSLRKLDIPLDTEPAFSFHPGLPDRQPIRGPQRFGATIPATGTVRTPGNLEDVAFWRVTELAPLVRSRAVSSTDLTRMYIERMTKYSPKLLCLITPTTELALEQAAAADKEIKAGHYRGPLHGIPFGLKDLFDTKGILTTWVLNRFRIAYPIRMQPLWIVCTRQARCLLESSRWVLWRRAVFGSKE